MLEKNKELLEKIAVYYIAQLKADLKEETHYATGRLEKSIYHFIKDNEIVFGSTYTNEEGLLGLTEGREAKAGKKPNPKGEFVKHVEDWMRKRGMQPQVRREKSSIKGKGMRSRGGRFRKVTPSIRRKAAYAVAIGILRGGYTGSKTIEKSYRKLESRIDADILEAYKKHLEEEVNKITLK